MSAGPEPIAFAVVDIDGVLADVEHRRHHVEGPSPRWDRFFAAAADDPPLAQGLALARSYADRGLLLVYLSGRPERLRSVTQAWLDGHDLPAGDLVLRPDGDHSPARVLKLRALRTIARVAPVAVLLDDDEDVVEAVRRARPRVVQDVVLADWQPGGARTRRMLRRVQEREGRT